MSEPVSKCSVEMAKVLCLSRKESAVHVCLKEKLEVGG